MARAGIRIAELRRRYATGAVELVLGEHIDLGSPQPTWNIANTAAGKEGPIATVLFPMQPDGSTAQPLSLCAVISLWPARPLRARFL